LNRKTRECLIDLLTEKPIANGSQRLHSVGVTFTAKVEDGKVVLPPEVKLPTGTTVRVETLDSTLPSEPIGRKLQALDGAALGMPRDLAQNHDHYLHGKPKRSAS